MFPYTKESLNVNDTEYGMLKEAYEQGGIPAFALGANAYELKTHQICAEDIIQRLGKKGFVSSYAPKRDSISQRELERIAAEVFGSSRDVESYRIFGHVIKAMIRSRSGKQSWQAVFDLDDNGTVTGACSYFTPFPGAGVPMLLKRELRSRVRSALYE